MSASLADIWVVDAYGRRWLNFHSPVKRCTHCGCWRSREDGFNRRSASRDGLFAKCRICRMRPQKVLSKCNGPLTAERLREILSYDPDTGESRWLVRKGTRVFPGDIAGCRDRKYRIITIDGHSYLKHRLAWLHQTGKWPPKIDHRDLDGHNNRWSNLRVSTDSQNQANTRAQKNNKLGVKGVWFGRGKFRAQICVNGRDCSLGAFDSIEGAAEAYRLAAVAAHGDFARVA